MGSYGRQNHSSLMDVDQFLGVGRCRRVQLGLYVTVKVNVPFPLIVNTGVRFYRLIKVPWLLPKDHHSNAAELMVLIYERQEFIGFDLEYIPSILSMCKRF